MRRRSGSRQARAGVEQDANAREERSRERFVGFERIRQQRPAARHVEIERRRDLAQVAQRRADLVRAAACRRPRRTCRRGAVRYRRSCCRRRYGSTAPNRPAPGAATAAGQTCATIVWFAHSMRCVVITPFGVPVEPDVNKIFAVVSGPTAVCARSAAAGSSSSAAASRRIASRGAACATRSASAASGTNAAHGRSTSSSARKRAGSAFGRA